MENEEPVHPSLRRGNRASVVLVSLACALGIGIPLLPSFGVTWDFMQTALYGERYLEFSTSLDRRFLDFTTPQVEYERPYPPTEPDPESSVQSFSAPHFVWPVPYTLASFSCRILYFETEWFDDPFTAHYAMNLVLIALLFSALWCTLRPSFGRGAPLLVCATFSTYPAFFSHVFNNLRDIPVTVFFCLSLLSIYQFLSTNKRSALLHFWLWLSLALASKTNAILVPPIAVAAILSSGLAKSTSWPRVGSAILWVCATSILALGGCLLLWPWMWPWLFEDGFLHLKQHINFIRQVRDVNSGFDFTPILEVIGTLPLVTLGLGFIGMLHYKFWRRLGRLDLYFLSLFWTLVPILRICLPRARNYGGVRHFLEFAPGFSILAAVGGLILWKRAPNAWCRLALLAIITAGMAVPVVTSFPDGSSRYNVLVGGVRGARLKELSAAYDFWGNTYRRGISWINEHAESQSALIAPVGEHILRMYSYPKNTDIPRTSLSASHDRTWLRDDLSIELPDEIGASGKGRVYVIELTRRDGDPEQRYPWLTKSLVSRAVAHVISIDEEPLMKIYDLGMRRDVAPWLEASYEKDRALQGSNLPKTLQRARENPNDVQALLEAYQILVRVSDKEAAIRFIEELLPKVDDPVLRDRMWRLVVEGRPIKNENEVPK